MSGKEREEGWDGREINEEFFVLRMLHRKFSFSLLFRSLLSHPEVSTYKKPDKLDAAR